MSLFLSSFFFPNGEYEYSFIMNKATTSFDSPFLLAMPGAKIIDLDNHSRIVDSWTELTNPRTYFSFFKKHEQEFCGAV